MAVYAYTGVNEKGRTVRGTVDADSGKSGRQLRRKQGVYVEEARPLASEPRSGAKGSAKGRGGPAESEPRTKAAGARALAALGEGGSSTPTLAALGAAIKKAASSSQRHVAVTTRQLATLLKAGIPLPEAHSAVADPVDTRDLRTAIDLVGSTAREGSSFNNACDAPVHTFWPGCHTNVWKEEC